MKLIFCTECLDVIKLKRDMRSCDCGKSSGRYTGPTNVKISGPCVPIGINNWSFGQAQNNRPLVGFGKEFSAFVIPVESEEWEEKNG